MRSPQPRAHPSPPSVSLLSPPLARSGFRHLDGYHTRRRSPPAGFATDRGRGSNPRDGTAAWTPPRRREAPHGLTEGGLLPVAPTGGASCLPPPRHVGSNHDPCRSLNRQGGFAGGCDSRRSAEILSRERGGKSKETEVERDARGSAGCAWAGPFGKLVRRVGLATLVRGRRHNAIDAGITEMSPAGALEVT